MNSLKSSGLNREVFLPLDPVLKKRLQQSSIGSNSAVVLHALLLDHTLRCYNLSCLIPHCSDMKKAYRDYAADVQSSCAGLTETSKKMHKVARCLVIIDPKRKNDFVPNLLKLAEDKMIDEVNARHSQKAALHQESLEEQNQQALENLVLG